MSLKLKESVALDRLREFGFKPTAELIASDCRYEPIFDGCRYMFPWWHLFLQDPDTGGPRVDEDSGNPILHAWVDTCDGENCLWFDVMPECTYHAGMDDLNLVTDTVFKLTQAGLIEIVKEEPENV